jgi:hypothetical protein
VDVVLTTLTMVYLENMAFSVQEYLRLFLECIVSCITFLYRIIPWERYKFISTCVYFDIRIVFTWFMEAGFIQPGTGTTDQALFPLVSHFIICYCQTIQRLTRGTSKKVTLHFCTLINAVYCTSLFHKLILPPNFPKKLLRRFLLNGKLTKIQKKDVVFLRF